MENQKSPEVLAAEEAIKKAGHAVVKAAKEPTAVPKGILGKKLAVVKIGGPAKPKANFHLPSLPNDMLMVQIKAQKAKGAKGTPEYLKALEDELEKRKAKK